MARSVERTRRRAVAAFTPAHPFERGPVVIGGVGGSGTRVVARIVNELGYFMGNDQSPQEDNMWFTLLFRRPQWYAAQVESNGTQIDRTLGYFEQAMTGTLRVDDELRAFVADATVEMDAQGRTREWTEGRIENIFDSRWLRPRERNWGWKEPNSHFYLDQLNSHFGDRLRYIHVMRHGLDMAWSANQHQVERWGPLFGIHTGPGPVDPSASLDFWIAANVRAIEVGKTLGDRFMLVNFDELSRNPHSLLGGLFEFLDCQVPDVQSATLAAQFKVPETVGRYRAAGLSSFSPDQLEQVRALGFTVET